MLLKRTRSTFCRGVEWLDRLRGESGIRPRIRRPRWIRGRAIESAQLDGRFEGQSFPGRLLHHTAPEQYEPSDYANRSPHVLRYP